MDRYNGAQWYSGSTGSDFDRVNWIGLRSCLHSALYLLNTSLLSVSMVPYINIKKILLQSLLSLLVSGAQWSFSAMRLLVGSSDLTHTVVLEMT